MILADAGHIQMARDMAGGRRRVLPLEIRHGRSAEIGAANTGPETPAILREAGAKLAAPAALQGGKVAAESSKVRPMQHRTPLSGPTG